MKKLRFLSIIALFVVFLCAMYAGVLAASSFKKVDVGGTISIPANMVGVRVEGFLGDIDVDDVVDGVNIIRAFDTGEVTGGGSTQTWSISSDYLSFDLSSVDENKEGYELSSVPAKYLTLRITNSGSLTLKAYFMHDVSGTDTQFSTTSLTLEGKQNAISANVLDSSDSVVDVVTVYPTGTLDDETPVDVQVIKLRFSVNQILETSRNDLTFNYKFILQDSADYVG